MKLKPNYSIKNNGGLEVSRHANQVVWHQLNYLNSVCNKKEVNLTEMPTNQTDVTSN